MFTPPTKAEEYRITEVVSVRTKKQGNYALFVLRKKNWTTMKAIEAIASQLGIAPTRFSVASYKVKMSVSSQYVTVSHVSLGELRKVRLKDVFIDPVGYVSKPLQLGNAITNEYSVVVRHLDRSLSGLHTFPNYYSVARFGRAENPHLHRIGKAIVVGDWGLACKLLVTTLPHKERPQQRGFRRAVWSVWKRQDFSRVRIPEGMHQEAKIISYLQEHPGDFKGAFSTLQQKQINYYVQAYQAYLFNLILAAYITSTYDEVKMLPLHIINAAVVVDVDDDVELPLVGSDCKMKGVVGEVLAAEGVSPSQFPVRTTSRRAFVGLTKLQFSSLDHDEKHKQGLKKQKVQFHLASGSYPDVALGCMDL